MEVEKIPEQRVPSEIVNESTTIPSYLQNSYNPRGIGIGNPKRFDIDIPPAIVADKYTSKIEFNIPVSQNLLDPYSLYLEIEIENDGLLPIQLDGSIHSLISRIEISVNGGYILECIKDYNTIHNIIYDMHLGKSERSQRKNFEGFGDNDFGTNETIIYPKFRTPVIFDIFEDENKSKFDLFFGKDNNNNDDKENETQKTLIANFIIRSLLYLEPSNIKKERIMRSPDSFLSEFFKKNLKDFSSIKAELNKLTNTKDLTELFNNLINVSGDENLNEIFNMVFSDSYLMLNKYPKKIELLNKIYQENINKFQSFNEIDGLEMENYETWKHVVNGEISPYQNDVLKIPAWGNVKKFRIPVMSKALGWGLPKEVYKFIPLNVFSGLKITFFFDDYAFFNPILNITERDYVLGTVKSKVEDTIKTQKGVIDKNKTCVWHIKNNAKIHTEQYRFSEVSGVHQRLTDYVKNGEYAFDYLGYEILSKDIIQKQAVNMPFNKSFSKKRIKSMYFFFTNDLYEWSHMARKNARYNMGIKRIKITNDCVSYPPDKIERYNSLNTGGPENGQFFYFELLKCMNSQFTTSDHLISPVNFCLEYQLSHALALQELSIRNETQKYYDVSPYAYSFTNRQWWKYYVNTSISRYSTNFNRNTLMNDYGQLNNISEFNRPLPDISSKTLYTINFETLPFSNGVYKNLGIDIRCEVPVMFEIDRDQKHINSDIFNSYSNINYYLWIMLESYETYVLKPDGDVRNINF